MDNSRSFQLAGFWERVFALIIDLILIKILNLILIGLGILGACQALQDLSLTSPSEDLVVMLGGLFILAGLLVFIVYFFYFNLNGQTPGKKIVGLRIISSTSPEFPLSFSQALTRTFGLFLSFFFFGLGFVIMLFNKKRQTLHDILAGTRVIKT